MRINFDTKQQANYYLDSEGWTPAYDDFWVRNKNEYARVFKNPINGKWTVTTRSV